MPLYEFECCDCQNTFEQIVRSASDVGSVVCKSCHSTNIKKIISAGSHRLGNTPSGSLSGPQPGGCRAGSPFR